MSGIERENLDQTMRELNEARRECERLKQELASAQGAIKTYIAGLGVLSAERDRYKRKLADMEDDAVAAYIDHADGVAACIEERRSEQPAETELERKAWELFAAAMASGARDISPEQSFVTAWLWIGFRDQRRKAVTT